MTIRATQWTRRQFSYAMAAGAAAAFVKSAGAQSTKYAFVTTSEGIQVFRAGASRWTLLHEASAATPGHIVLHPSLLVLYFLHDVDQWGHLPRGAVSTYGVNTITGALQHHGTQPLSLSATNPRHAVVTADQRSLFVAAHTGGIYNQLPIAKDGMLMPVSAIRKEYGSGDENNPGVSTPLAAVTHPDGSIFTTDPGQGTVSRFNVTDVAIPVRYRTRVHAGGGSSQIVLSLDGQTLYAMSAENHSVERYSVRGTDLSRVQQTLHTVGGEMAMHPSGRFLLIAGNDRTQILRIDARTGTMAEHRISAQSALRSLRFSQDGNTLVALRADAHTIVSLPFDSSTGTLGRTTSLATVNNGIALLHTL